MLVQKGNPNASCRLELAVGTPSQYPGDFNALLNSLVETITSLVAISVLEWEHVGYSGTMADIFTKLGDVPAICEYETPRNMVLN